MANTALTREGFGQIEPNRCTFLHDGNIESQCKAAADLENGVIVTVDKANLTVSAVTQYSTLTGGDLVGINYTAEKIYNQFTPGLKNFKVKANEYPRVGYLVSGDIYTTNAMIDSTGLSEIDVATIASGLYLDTPTTVTTEAPTAGLILQVVEKTTMPDGQDALKIQVKGII